MTDRIEDEVTKAILKGSSHKISENGRGGYRCSGCNLEFDWNRSEMDRAKLHSKEQMINKVLAIIAREANINDKERAALDAAYEVQKSQAVLAALDFIREEDEGKVITEDNFSKAYWLGILRDQKKEEEELDD